MDTPDSSGASASLSPGVKKEEIDQVKVRKVVLSCLSAMLHFLANLRTKIRCGERGGQFQSDREQPQWCMEDLTKWPERVHDFLSHIFEHDEHDSRHSLWDLLIALPNEKVVIKLMGHFRNVCLLCGDVVSRWPALDPPIAYLSLPSCSKEHGLLHLRVLANNRLELTWSCGGLHQDALTVVEEMLDVIRKAGRPPTCDEYFATHWAYLVIREGFEARTSRVCPLGIPGFHAASQTYLSLTNSGEGHVQGTTRREDWLRGALVHVEHIERPVALPVEAYRMPCWSDLARVRLHAGSTAPTTCFIGRLHADGDLVTVVHFVASAASQAFSQGAAECKISMFGLSTSQALKLMRVLDAQVQKTPHHILSAAWSLTQPLKDDLPCAASDQLIKEAAHIARRSVEVTALGGFSKVTWDGSRLNCPSKCPMQALGYRDALTAVHVAHEHGLLTYFSAGFQLDDIPAAVYTGVDGIGMGGVLHLLDRATGILGPYKEEDISAVLGKRDEAAAHTLGQAAWLMARLDSMFSEGSISFDENQQRPKLFQALIDYKQSQGAAKDDKELEIKELMNHLDKIQRLPSEDFQPFLHRAKRLLEAESPMMRQSCSQDQWQELRDLLQSPVSKGDEEELMEKYGAEPWVSMRQAWRGDQGLPVCDTLPLLM